MLTIIHITKFLTIICVISATYYNYTSESHPEEIIFYIKEVDGQPPEIIPLHENDAYSDFVLKMGILDEYREFLRLPLDIVTKFFNAISTDNCFSFKKLLQMRTKSLTIHQLSLAFTHFYSQYAPIRDSINQILCKFADDSNLETGDGKNILRSFFRRKNRKNKDYRLSHSSFDIQTDIPEETQVQLEAESKNTLIENNSSISRSVSSKSDGAIPKVEKKKHKTVKFGLLGRSKSLELDASVVKESTNNVNLVTVNGLKSTFFEQNQPDVHHLEKSCKSTASQENVHNFTRMPEKADENKFLRIFNQKKDLKTQHEESDFLNGLIEEANLSSADEGPQGKNLPEKRKCKVFSSKLSLVDEADIENENDSENNEIIPEKSPPSYAKFLEIPCMTQSDISMICDAYKYEFVIDKIDTLIKTLTEAMFNDEEKYHESPPENLILGKVEFDEYFKKKIMYINHTTAYGKMIVQEMIQLLAKDSSTLLKTLTSNEFMDIFIAKPEIFKDFNLFTLDFIEEHIKRIQKNERKNRFK